MTDFSTVPVAEFAAALVAAATSAGADAVQAVHVVGSSFEVGFDHRSISGIRTIASESTDLIVYRRGKRGGTRLNSRGPDQVEAAIADALMAADAGIPDPAHDVAEAPSMPPTRRGQDTPDREGMVRAVERYIAELTDRYPLIRSRDCSYAFIDTEALFANSRGVRQQGRRGLYRFNAIFGGQSERSSTSFCTAAATSLAPFESLIAAGNVGRKIDETLRSFNPRPAPEGFVGDVIFTPDCVPFFIAPVAAALSGGALMAGTSPFRGRKGELIASPLFSLLNRPRAPDFVESFAFDGFGIPTRDLDVVTDGVLRDFMVDFHASRKLGLDHTAGIRNLVVASGERAIADIIRDTRRGIIVSRFSGGAPNSNLDFSGVAKNSFYVEAGEIRHPLIETMISGNFQELLRNIHAVSSETVNFGGASYPYVAAAGVTISAATAAAVAPAAPGVALSMGWS
jgi:PmbA protein